MSRLSIQWTRTGLLSVISVWSIVSISGFSWLVAYAASPGSAGLVPTEWPVGSRVALDPTRDNLIVALHPHCPCSRATLHELAEIMAQCEQKASVHVLVYQPLSAPDGWEFSDLWHSAAGIPGVQMVTDDEGAEAARFGAETSGQTALYDGQGHLLFHGGITIARGHEGANPGQTAVIELLMSRTSGESESCVFGCPLIAERSRLPEARQ
jgi:hypothetical protein